MGRKRLSEDLRKVCRSYSLAVRHRALLETVSNQWGLSESEALRRLLDLAEQQLSAQLRDSVVRRRAAMQRDARLEAIRRERREVTSETSWPSACPSCGDPSNIVRFPDGRWDCNVCGTRGKVEILQPA